MNNYELKDIKETFCRLFVLAVSRKMNMTSFTNLLMKSDFISSIEKGYYVEVVNKRIEKLFYEISYSYISEDDSYGVYNDAYWCGSAYFSLYLKLHKSFSYLFLKLPFKDLMDLYPIYHEMDVTSLEELFIKKEKEKTIIRLLCEMKGCSLSKLSESTGININTLSKYNANDENLYKGSFQNVVKLVNYFDVPINLFVK